MTVWAYYRVSTGKQDIDSQKVGVYDYAKRQGLKIDKEILDDGVSGVVLAKDRNLNKIIKQSQKGDKVIVPELSRLGRSTSDVINTCNQFIVKGVNVYFIKQSMSLDNTPMGKMMVAILSAFSEMERDLIRQRSIEGIARAKAEGKQIGRPYGFTYCSLDSKKDEIQQMLRDGYNYSQIARKLNTSWATLYRFLKLHGLYKAKINVSKNDDRNFVKVEKYTPVKKIPAGVITEKIITKNSIKIRW